MKSIDDAIIQVESGDENHPDGNDEAVGDLNISQHAYGCMQVRQPVCTDVNAVYHTRFSPQQFLGKRSLSRAMFWLYMSIYCTSAQLGRIPTDEDRARIWNGGPGGWSNPGTVGYWQKVSAAME